MSMPDAIAWAVAALLAVLTLRFAGKRFVAWNLKPRELSPQQVAAVLRGLLDGTATDGELDFFISVDIADPALNEVKDEVGSLYGPNHDPQHARQTLERLLDRVERMAVPQLP